MRRASTKETSSADHLSRIISQKTAEKPVGGKNAISTVLHEGSSENRRKSTCTVSWRLLAQNLTWTSVALGFTVWLLAQPLVLRSLPPYKHEEDSVSTILNSWPLQTQNTATIVENVTVNHVMIQNKDELIRFSPPEKVVTINHVMIQNKTELSRLSPPEKVVEQASLQLDEELMIFAGGYWIESYNVVSRSIQFFHIPSQRWMPERRLELPPGIADTHQGVAFDSDTRMLYIVSGQLGGGCSPAVTTVARINVDTGEYEILPSLPDPRYHPGVAIITDPADPEVKHLHVFGGAVETRNQTATDHWRLILEKGRENVKHHPIEWQQLETVPDAGIHGRAFVHNGAIYYTAFCDLDQGTIENENMLECQRTAFHSGRGQLLHHTSDAGFLFRYVTDFAPEHQHSGSCNHWERLPDMPFPACHTGSTLGMGRFFLFGGGMVTKQVQNGSPPRSLNMIQMFNFVTQSWETASFKGARNMKTYNLGVWMDIERSQLFGLRSEETLLVGQIESHKDGDAPARQLDEFKAHRLEHLDTNRHLAVNQFNGCLNSELSKFSGNQSMEMHSMFDSGYESVRMTWNKRLSHLQYPDVVTFPNSPMQVSMIVQCARRTGHHVCGRNGKHSFEGDTCTYGIVIDVAKMSSVEIIDHEKGKVRFGSGQHLGRIAVAMEEHGLVLPMGHCASVGMTGLVLVGGQGVMSRHLGMTSDYVSGIQLVDHNGQLINATTTNEYSDYVWLARGGGSAVQHFPGIITSIEFSNLPKLDVKKVKQKVYTSFRIDYFNVTVDNAERLLLAWQEFYLDKDNINDPIFDRLTVEPWIWYYPIGKDPALYRKLYLTCYFYGNDELHQQFMERFLPKLMNLLDGGTLSKIDRLDDLAFHRYLAGVVRNDKLASGKDGWDLHEARRQGSMNRWKAYSALASNRVSGKAFRDLAESIFYSQPLTRRFVEFKPLGGAIQKLDKNETAFWHRDAIWLALSSHWHWSTDSVEVVDAIHRNSRERHDEFVKNMGSSFSGCYAGYIDHGNSTGRDLERYYGKNAGRIAQIKKNRDPSNIFRLYLPNTPSNAPFNPSNLVV